MLEYESECMCKHFETGGKRKQHKPEHDDRRLNGNDTFKNKVTRRYKVDKDILLS